MTADSAYMLKRTMCKLINRGVERQNQRVTPTYVTEAAKSKVTPTNVTEGRKAVVIIIIITR
jgi:hypothetical protein